MKGRYSHFDDYLNATTVYKSPLCAGEPAAVGLRSATVRTLRSGMRRLGLVLLVALSGCGGSGIEGTLEWDKPPALSAHSLTGSIQNTTSHSLSLDPKRMRLLDERGRKMAARIRIGRGEIASGNTTSLRATWTSGKPVRIDYGAGTLALPSP